MRKSEKLKVRFREIKLSETRCREIIDEVCSGCYELIRYDIT